MMYAFLLNHLSDFILSKLWTCAKSFRNQANKLSIAKPIQEQISLKTTLLASPMVKKMG